MTEPRTQVLGIDPDYGKDSGGCACALSEGGLFVSAWFERPSHEFAVLPRLSAVVVEKPQQDERSAAVPPAVLIQLAWVGAAVAYRYQGGAPGCVVVELEPRAWKGSEPKPVQHARLWRILEPAERAVFGGEATERVIRAALDKGAATRWARSGGSYYPRAFSAADKLDAACISATYLGRLLKAR